MERGIGIDSWQMVDAMFIDHESGRLSSGVGEVEEKPLSRRWS
jgi:hypothetical protein